MNFAGKIRRKARGFHRHLREFRVVVKGLCSSKHPILVHLIPTRRCNLSCTYCNEYDDHSDPVPTSELFRRIDRLASMGTSIITISGGEPLLHPDLDEIICRIRRQRMIAGLLTNGYLLTEERIRSLNRAGLDHMQISVDNVQPDDTSKKSLKVLDKKLELLAQHALFQVNLNSVLGAGVEHPEDALAIARRALELGMGTTVGIIHDGSGQLSALSRNERRIFEQVKTISKKSFGRINVYNPFQKKLVAGKPNNWWRCRAGSRYLYICEDGLGHYCSQQRGYPGVPLEDYTADRRRREYLTRKDCAPYCTVSCVHQVSIIDRWRDPQTLGYTQQPRNTLVRLGAAR